jgi:hypothetical protein
MPRIQVTIGKDGTPAIDAQGFLGGACKQATATLTEKFKGAAVQETEKAELHMVEPVSQDDTMYMTN